MGEFAQENHEKLSNRSVDKSKAGEVVRREYGKRRGALAKKISAKAEDDNPRKNRTTIKETPEEKTQKHELLPEQAEEIMKKIKTRFHAKENRFLCPELEWDKVEEALKKSPEAVYSIYQMEKNGHEPAVYFFDETGFDVGTFAKESPKSTRNCVYDKEAEEWLKINEPGLEYNGNAVDQAKAIGVELMTVEQGKYLYQNTYHYHEEGNRWYKTPKDVRNTEIPIGGGCAINGRRHGVHLYGFETNSWANGNKRGWSGSIRINFVD